jgi:hypothetical protein
MEKDMREKGAHRELLAIRNAAACLRIGGKLPYRLRKEGITAWLVHPPPLEESSSVPDPTGRRGSPACLRSEEDILA